MNVHVDVGIQTMLWVLIMSNLQTQSCTACSIVQQLASTMYKGCAPCMQHDPYKLPQTGDFTEPLEQRGTERTGCELCGMAAVS